MPVEVKELIIKAVIDDQTRKEKKDNSQDKINREEIIEDCVDQVLEILKKQKER